MASDTTKLTAINATQALAEAGLMKEPSGTRRDHESAYVCAYAYACASKDSLDVPTGTPATT